MAVGFQRRNIGRLVDLGNTAAGTEAYVDYGASPIAMAGMPQADSAPTDAAPAQGYDVASGGADGMQRAEAAAAQLIAAAEAQRKAAGNPLNRILSGVGGVIGAPFAFLDAALNGGDMSQVTAPFRPQQTADQRFAQTQLAIQDSLAKIRENYAQMGASQASAISAATKSRADMVDETYSALANLATNANDPTNPNQDPRLVYAEGLLNLMQHPVYGSIINELGLNRRQWTPTLARELAYGKDVVSRLDSKDKPVVVNTSENGVSTILDPRTLQPKLVIQQGNVSAPTVSGSTPPPAQIPPPPPGFVLEN